MSKLDLIRAGHTEVADGQCWLCDVPWPCDTGVVLAALTAAEARAEQAERERDAERKCLREDGMNDAARLVDELTTLLYETLKAWQTQDGRHHQIVQCGACRRKADKPKSVVHESDCPVYRLQRAEAANDAVIKGNAEEIADLEDARDAADARANAEWARAEGEQKRAEQAERERDAADEEAQNARSVAQMAASDRDEAMDNFDNLSLELERLEKQLTADNAALRERLATVEAALLIADELSDDLEDVAQELANRTHGQPRYEPIIRAALQTVTRYNEARAALAATPAAGEVQP